MIGRILKGIGGFYYIVSENTIFECKLRGIFRKQKITPLPGDIVEYEQLPENTGIINKILDRKNYLIRPPVANIDKLFIVITSSYPTPSFLLTDRLIAMCSKNEIEPIILINKIDEGNPEEIDFIYKNAGYKTILASAKDSDGKNQIIDSVGSSVCAFSGCSGVGKSSLINMLFTESLAAVGEISEKIKHGRNTTRHVELFSCNDGYIVDTPGFDELTFDHTGSILKEDLKDYFREFYDYYENCKYSGCMHMNEPCCAVKDAVADGKIAKSRYESYCYMFNECKGKSKWQIK